MDKPNLVEGGIFTDERGILTHCNDLDMSEVERFYVIKHPDKSVIRAWHAHQDEKKWFYEIGRASCRERVYGLG